MVTGSPSDRRSKQRCAVCRRGKGWGHRSRGGKGGSFTSMDGYFSGRFCTIFGKMIQHHRTVMWFKCWSWKKFCTSFNMENLPLTLGLCISVGFLWCFSTFLESLESLFTGIGTSDRFAKFWEAMIIQMTWNGSLAVDSFKTQTKTGSSKDFCF